jgi:predicted transcriptional regulator
LNHEQLVSLTADIVSAHLANNTVAVGDVANLIQQVHGSLSGLGKDAPEEPQAKSPMVSVRASVKPDYLVCMECGLKQTMLKRHLQTAHGMTPEQYRADYGLPRDYPMSAPNYSERRRTLAMSIGLGRKKPAADAAETVTASEPAAKPMGRRKSAAAAPTSEGSETPAKTSRGRNKAAAKTE